MTVAYVLIWFMGVLGGFLVGYGFADRIERWHDERSGW